MIVRHAREPDDAWPFFEASLDLLAVVGFDGYFRRLNPAWTRVLGHEPKELMRRPSIAFVHPDDVEATLAEASRQTVDGVDTLALENRYRASDGSYRWLLWSAKVDRERELLYSVAKDVTERRQTELRYRQLFEAIPEPSWVYDTRTLDFLAVNEAALRQYGYSREEFAAMTIRDIRPESSGPGRHRLKDGSVISVEIVSHELAWGGRPAKLVLSRDVSAREAAERSRRAAEARAERAERMASIGRLAGGIAHDFNNLLVVILNYSAFLTEALPDDEALRGDLAEIQGAAGRASELTQRLLTLSRRKVIQPVLVDLSAVIDDMHQSLRDSMGERVDLELQLEGGLPPVSGDPSEFGQVLIDLVVNAREAMPGGGTATIRTTTVELDAGYVNVHSGVGPGSYVQLTVTDNGAGMDPEVREHAHEPFFTTKPPGEASGLGLATVDGIVKQAGGSVEVYSEVGVGTSVKIFLPVAAGGARRAPRDDGNEDGAGRKVLVVEDQESVRKLTCRILADRDFEVLETADPEQALALVAGAGVDLLLTDVIMPEMSGRDLADRAVALDPRLRVLYMSGYSADFVATSGVIEQGVCLVEKPFTAAVLLGAVRNALDDS